MPARKVCVIIHSLPLPVKNLIRKQWTTNVTAGGKPVYTGK